MALRAFNVRERSANVSVAEENGDKHEINTPKRFQITLDGGMCSECNNEGQRA